MCVTVYCRRCPLLSVRVGMCSSFLVTGDDTLSIYWNDALSERATGLALFPEGTFHPLQALLVGAIRHQAQIPSCEP